MSRIEGVISDGIQELKHMNFALQCIFPIYIWKQHFDEGPFLRCQKSLLLFQPAQEFFFFFFGPV